MNGLRIFFTGIFIFLCFSGLYSQSMEEIKKKQAQTEKEINYLNKLLSNTRSDQSATLSKLSILNEKISRSKELIFSLEEEVKFLERELENNENKRGNISLERQKLLDVYAATVYETWKKQKRTDKLSAIFSASDLSQVYSRYRYFGQLQDYSKKQLEEIARTNDSLTTVQKSLNDLLAKKNAAQKELSGQQCTLIGEQKQASIYVDQLKKKEQELDKKLKNEIRNREKYKKELQKIVAEQIKKSGSNTSKYNLTPEEKLISDDFAKNKGRLPWPVAEGFISEKFGINVSPVARLVKLNNDGITITTNAHAEVRAVFGGVVSEIVFIAGQNNVILIRHGNYFTLYNNIVEVFVKRGEKVQPKQKIGKLAENNEGSSTLNFQIWKDKEILDPQLWLSK